MVKRIGAWLGGLLVVGFVRVRLRLSEPAAGRAAAGLGRVLGWLGLGRGAVVRRNLARAFPGLTAAERAGIAREFWRGTAVWFADLLALFRDGRAAYTARFQVEGLQRLRDAAARGKGVIVVSAHLGPFPDLAPAIAALGVPCAFLYRKPKEARIRRLFDDWMERSGGAIIEDAPRHTAGLRCLAALDRGEAVCLLADQHFPAGVEVPFFGHPAKAGLGAALLSRRSGAPLLPVRATRLAGGRVRIRIEPPLEPPADRSREALTATTARVASVIEGWIRDDPAGWFWLHRRWKDLDRAEEQASPGV